MLSFFGAVALNRKTAKICLVGLAFFVVACNTSEHVDEGRKAVDQFHERLNSERYAAIYADADETFRNQSTEKDFTAILAAVHRKLGAVTKTEPAGWFVNSASNGTFVKLSYKTQFKDAAATESFGWRAVDGQCRLTSYDINSAALITR